MTYPYTYYSCPCTNIETSSTAFDDEPKPDAPDTDDEQSFNPHSPQANFALYPIENLLFCNECHEIRCPRCYFEEVLYYYCPQCLFETPSTTVKTETNRCTRSCFQCPICIAPLQLQGFSSSEESRTKSDQPATQNGPFILSCPFCMWSTLEIGIKFEKSVNISSQLARIKNGGEVIPSTDRRTSMSAEGILDVPPVKTEQTEADHFNNLIAFYKNELSDPAGGSSLGLSSSLGLDSPSHLSRLLSTYGIGGLKRQRNKPQPVREALTPQEGRMPQHDPENPVDEDALVARMASLGWQGNTSVAQRSASTDTPAPRFACDARPIPMPLRSKRAKRCRACRHNLIRPDDKRQSTRFKIRLLALNYVPRATAAPLQSALDLRALRPGRPAQFLLTLRNPLFDPVKIHLATPQTTPGRVSSKVTILCPQFDIGASADVWDEALASGDKDRRRTKGLSPADGQSAEAGKIWEKGRNWTTVIVEVIPGNPDAVPAARADAAPVAGAEAGADAEKPKTSLGADDDDVLQVPVLVRMEYYTDQSGSDLPSSPESPTYKSTREDRVPRELQYWVVLGLGRIGRLGGGDGEE